MKVSINGILRNAAGDVRRVRRLTRTRASAIDEGMKRLAWALWTLSRTDEPGSVAINAFATYYLRELPLQAAIEALPQRPTRDIPQPGLTRFGLGELHENLVTLISRASEGKPAIREFFDCYVFEAAPEPTSAEQVRATHEHNCTACHGSSFLRCQCGECSICKAKR